MGSWLGGSFQLAPIPFSFPHGILGVPGAQITHYTVGPGQVNREERFSRLSQRNHSA